MLCREARLTTWICDLVRPNWIVWPRKHRITGNFHRQEASRSHRRGTSPLNGLNYHYIREVAALSRANARLCGFYLFANNGALLTGLAARASVYKIISYKRWLYSYPSYFPLPIAILKSVTDSRYLSKREVNGIDGCANRFLINK